MRRWLRIGLAVGALGALLALAVGGWLLRSEGGRDWLLARVVASLPAGSSLHWQRLQGSASGPLLVEELDYRQADGLRLRAHRLRIDHSLWPLLAKRWQVHRLDAEGVVLDLPRDDAPFEWPRWPELLPKLDLPLAVSVEALTVRGLVIAPADAPPVRFDRVAAGVQLGPGELVVRKLDARGPRWTVAGSLDYRPRDNYRSAADLRVAADGRALRLIGRGNLDHFVASVDGRVPAVTRLRVTLDEGRATPRWHVDAESEGLDPAWFGLPDAATWQGRLRVDGRGGDAALAGHLDRDGMAIALDGSRLRADARGLALAPLRLGLAQGPLQAEGQLDFSQSPANFDLRLSTPGLRLAASEPGAEAVRVAGGVQARGRLDRWTLGGELSLQRGEERARLALQGRGDVHALVLERLQARMPSGRLDGAARLQWSPTLAVHAGLQLEGFDPGYFAPDFPGRLAGRLDLQAGRDEDGRWSGVLDVPALRGVLRGRPLQAQARADWAKDRGEGSLTLALGTSRAQAGGRFGDTLDLQAEARPLDLADLWPQARGRLQGRLALRGPRGAPEIDADLEGRQLRWGEVAAGQLRLRGRLPDAPGQGEVLASLRGLAFGGQVLDEAELRATGHRRALRVEATLAGRHGRLQATGDARQAGSEWSGHLQALALSPARGEAWRLSAPVAWAAGPQGLRFEQACLREAAGGGEACARLDRALAIVHGEGLALALVEPWLGESLQDYEAVGALGLEGRFERAGAHWNGRLDLRSPAGALRWRAIPDTPLLAYREFQLGLVLREGRVQARGGAALSQGGRFALEASGGLDAGDAIEGRLDLDLRDLAWMELLSPDLAAPAGKLEGALTLAGTRAAPRLGAELRLADWRAELPALGVDLREGDIRIAGAPGGVLRIEGGLRAGEGRLRVDGQLDLGAEGQPLTLAVAGDNLRLSDTPELQASVSPRLQLRYLGGELQVRGTVAVPSARLDLERLDQGVSASPDVVVMDPRPGRRRAGLVFDTEVTVRVGGDVRLQGFGLDGTLAGELAIRDHTGRVALANGNLEVSGRYRAYGRSLRIRRARLGWVNAPYDDPVLDVLAEHEFDEVTVGVRVRGSAQAPQTSITSDPAMGTAEAISWLLLGRPLETATGPESARISASAVAISAGSSLLAQQLGVQLGLDSAGIVENRALGGSTLVVGKRLSPRLFVSYGVSLLGTGQVVMLKYLLRRGLSVGLESGTVETAASLDWRKEK